MEFKENIEATGYILYQCFILPLLLLDILVTLRENFILKQGFFFACVMYDIEIQYKKCKSKLSRVNKKF